MSPDEIAERMDGVLAKGDDGRLEAYCHRRWFRIMQPLSSAWMTGPLACLWFGGSLEGKSDISITLRSSRPTRRAGVRQHS